MRDLVVSLGVVLADIEREKGPFQVKCLVTPDPVEPMWDLVLVAQWFWPERKQTLDFLVPRVMGRLDYEHLMHFSGLVIYPPDSDNPLTEALREIQDNHRHHRDDWLRAGGLVTVQTRLPQARLVIPLDDEPPSADTASEWNATHQACA
ncbi:hypothetical protein Thiowin_03254 [Thiorhodovibrio winogradskyi]|uniref:Uncharacterized protein n=1 Tax=Thiorhodovibrio winogradskyi TaxID=77007 RepID=A0ABZ0SC92_9GAMM|nr:hypothetical protein [Thiorhodovibrio winogradskyi]